MAKRKKFYDDWEFDELNESVILYYQGEEIDGIALDALVEYWLGGNNYSIKD